MALPVALESLKAEALQTSCAAWAIRARWKLVKAATTELVGPCPVCGGDDRFAINTRTDLWNCRQCGGRGHGVIDLVVFADGVSFTRACEIITGRTAEGSSLSSGLRPTAEDEARMAALRDKAQADEAKRIETEERHRLQAIKRARRVLEGAVPLIRADATTAYLWSRGIGFADLPKGVWEQIRLGQVDAHPWMEKADRDYRQLYSGPAMIAAVRQPAGTVTAVHQTWLMPDDCGGWGKLSLPPAEDGAERAAKKVLGSKKGGAIRLFTPEAATRMVVGEGIETTLTALAHNFETRTAYWTSVDLGNWAGRAARAADGTALHDEPLLEESASSGEERQLSGSGPAGQPLSVADCFVVPDWVEEVIFLSDDDDARNHTEAKVVRGLKRALWQRDRRRAADPSLSPLAGWYMPPLGGGRDLNDLVRVK